MKLTRTHYCGEVGKLKPGEEVVLCGWVDRWRDHGGVYFIDLRDREGIVQVVFDPAVHQIEGAHSLRSEWVIAVKGTLRARPEGMTNSKIATGQYEVIVSELEVLSESKTPPFVLHEDAPSHGETDERLRLKYRYLELRKQKMFLNLKRRHQFLHEVRNFYDENGFLEVETPILYKSTPEGARDYLVPSRVQNGKCFALPQSPQTLKQLLMIGGVDKYYQIARCFRDEDLRADRQPEFTQIDVELSFTSTDKILSLHEKLMQRVFRAVLGKELQLPFQRMAYDQALALYGSDKPDLRNSLTLFELTELGKKSDFQVYKTILGQGGILKGLLVPEKTPLSRKELDGLSAQVAPFGAKGVSWIRIKAPGDWQAPQAKFFSPELKTEIEQALGGDVAGHLLFMVCGSPKIVNPSMSFLRDKFGEEEVAAKESEFHFCWITDFPLFEYNEQDSRFYALHHPFTRPIDEDLASFYDNDRQKILTTRADAYDLVVNGYEVGGGSQRINESAVQAKMFDHLGISPEQAQERFGYFLEALSYGTPPHGGIAFGVDRIAMLLSGATGIRDVIAFPKTQKASCLMSDAPSVVDDAQLEELGLQKGHSLE